MDRITAIEEALASVLSGIDGSNQGSFTYYSNTGTINVYDEALSLSRNTVSTDDDNKSVNYLIEENEDTGIETQDWEMGQGVATQRAVYVITGKVYNNGDESSLQKNPLNSIRKVMNGVIMDQLFAFAKNYHLNGQVEWIRPLSQRKVYTEKGNTIQSGKLITVWEVVFNQSLTNPNSNSCW